jgi:hypothetical protein
MERKQEKRGLREREGLAGGQAGGSAGRHIKS